MTIAAAADTGESSAWALVEWSGRGRPRLILVHEDHGAERLGWTRALEGAAVAHKAAREFQPEGPIRCAVEVPPPVVHRGHMAHHATGHGLGMRAGLLRAAWERSAGVLAGTQTPAEWWEPWRVLGLVLTGKTRWPGKRPPPGWVDGAERMGQAEMYVEGAAGVLRQVGSRARAVDVAESILQAGALAIGA